MANMKRLQFAKRITDWFFAVDPYNGSDYYDTWGSIVQDLTDRPQDIVQGIAYYTDPDDDPNEWTVRTGAALIKAIAAWEAGVPLPTDR